MFYSYDNLMHFCISVIIFYQTFFSSFLFPSQQDLNTLSIAPTLHSLQVWILAKAKHRMTNHNYWASYNKKCIFRVWIKNLRRVLWLEIIAANIKTLVVLNFDNFLSNKKKRKTCASNLEGRLFIHWLLYIFQCFQEMLSQFFFLNKIEKRVNPDGRFSTSLFHVQKRMVILQMCADWALFLFAGNTISRPCFS